MDNASSHSRFWIAAHAAPLAVGALAMVPALGPFHAYALRIFVTLAALFVFRAVARLYPLQFSARALAWGAIAGAGWYLLETYCPYPHPLGGPAVRTAEILRAAPVSLRMAAGGLRLLGFLILTPLVEELFFRAFLPRFLAAQDFRALAFEQTGSRYYLLSAIGFALVHREWASAFLFAFLMNRLLRKTGNPWSCVGAHAMANSVLALLGCW